MKMNEMSRSEEKNYKLVDLIKFICAFLVIGIHTRQFLSVSDIADRLFYYDVSNYSVPFFYACSGYFLLAKKDDYNNFKSYLICAGGALAVSEIYSWMKNISNRSTTVSRLKHD